MKYRMITPQQPDHPEGHFNAAQELPGGEREAFIAAACGGDASMLAAVRALITAQEANAMGLVDLPDLDYAPPGYLDATIAADNSERVSDKPAGKLESLSVDEAGIKFVASEVEGERIGRYKLLQQIGEGGFGAVWMAEQTEPVTRRVALKIIKLGMDTREVIARFEQERQALAMMDHPNIAKVLDAGSTDKGRPFFVMELVKGIPITQYCDEAGLGTRARLELFGDVCSAIQHAHQKGIIHRDIKPFNVMVTLHGDKPVVKVIDFGIAKATQGKLTDKTLFTKFEQFIGTPAYMSPEQASLSGLDIDTRSDIYALGVLLYELLTGKPPFDSKSLLSAGFEEMRRIIREVEPPKPSSRLSTVAGDERLTVAKARRIEPEKLSRLVEHDLDWIVMKAIDKDRSRRYETASAFAQDVSRFLADEPVTATPPSAGYQFRKFARRNKGALRVAAMIAAVLLAATAVSTWLAVRATRAEKRTAETFAQVVAERDAKEIALKEAEDISKFLSEVFESPDATRDGREIKVVELLEKAAKKVESDLSTQPDHRAKLQATLGATYSALGLYQESVSLREKVMEHHFVAFGPEHPETLTAMRHLASSYFEAGRRDEATQLRENLYTLCRKVYGGEHAELLWAMADLGDSYSESGRLDEARDLRKEAHNLSDKLFGVDHVNSTLASSNLAISHFEGSDGEEARKVGEEVLSNLRRLLGPEHPETLRAMNNLAVYYSAVGRHDESLRLRDDVLALRSKVFGEDHPETLQAMNNLAKSYAEIGRQEEALNLRKEVLTLSNRIFGPEHPDTLTAMSELAISYSETGRHDEALKLGGEVFSIRIRAQGPDHPETLSDIQNLAIYYRNTGREEEALKVWREYLEIDHKARVRIISTQDPFYDPFAPITETARKRIEAMEAEALEKEVPAIGMDPTAPPTAPKSN